jgi:hypothetical protein
VARALIDGPHLATIATSNADGRPQSSVIYEMYDRYMDGVAPPPEPESERVIVRITPEKLYRWPPVPAES